MGSWVPLLVGLCSLAAADTLVICPEGYRAGLKSWVEYRQAQGHEIRIVKPKRSAAGVRQQIREASRSGDLRFVLLVGDDQTQVFTSRRPLPLPFVREGIPAAHVSSQAILHWGGERLIASDSWYADLDEDGYPDVALGRLPVETAEQLATILDRTIRYETSLDRGPWIRRINFVAGVGGFGPLVDWMLESTTRRLLTEEIPDAYTTSMTYGNWRSLYCPDPRRFSETTLERLNEGCLFWVYLGHGQTTSLDRMRTPRHDTAILDTELTRQLQCGNSPPIAIFLSCYAGAFDGPEDCLAETMLKCPNGPVAVLAGSRVTMPYGMATLGDALLREHFESRPETLGRLVSQAKRQLATEPGDGNAEGASMRYWLDNLAKAVMGSAEALSRERQDHVHLFNLFGDPLLRLPHPAIVELNIPRFVDAGSTITVRGHAPLGGELRWELACRRDLTRYDLPARTSFPSSDSELAGFDESYRLANDHVWGTGAMVCSEGHFECQWTVPADAHGPCYVRAFISSGNRHGLGAAKVFVRRKASQRHSPGPVEETSAVHGPE